MPHPILLRWAPCSSAWASPPRQAPSQECDALSPGRHQLNEEGNEKAGQIQEYLDMYGGEGIQHIALGSTDLHKTVDALRQAKVKLLDTIDTYYELVDKRIPGHGENVAELQKRKILIDGKPDELLLQIFSENQLGPIFFEFIQRKGDQGFGEGNFKALFESIELDQMRRGVLKSETTVA
jgi:4-hydroxyphenylpyruvate dioxygenase